LSKIDIGGKGQTQPVGNMAVNDGVMLESASYNLLEVSIICILNELYIYICL